MKLFRLPVFTISAIALTSQIFASAVLFNSPQPWLTLRDSKLTAKVVIDTSLTKGKAVKLKAYAVKSGRKSLLNSTTIKGGEVSGELNATLTGKLIGGKDYVSIDWSVLDLKGTLAPVGYMPLEGEGEKFEAKMISKEYDVKNFKETVKVNNSVIDFAWTKDALVVAAKLKDEDIIIKFDMKNGKNAFSAFADRCLTLSNDSTLIKKEYPNRVFTKKGIEIDKKEWKSDITIEKDKDIVIATIPWYDLGIVANQGRIFGIGLFNESGKNAFPPSAKMLIPGTWGNVILK